MSRILITGHLGLIGSRLTKRFIERGQEVYGIDDGSGGLPENGAGNHDFRGSITYPRAVDYIFDKIRPEIVYHMAAYAAEGLSPFIRNFNYQNNLIGSVNVINACINYGVKRLIFTSSMAVMGHGNPPFKESDPVNPADPYGIAKAAVEQDIKLAHEQFGLDYVILRPHNVIGVGQNIFDRYRNVVGIFIRQVLNNKPITIYGDGLQKRAFSDVHYMLDFLADMTRNNYPHSPVTLNVGADHPITILELAKLVQQIGKRNGKHSDIVHLEERQEVKHAYSDHTLAQLHGFDDRTDIEKTITDMYQWAEGLPNRPLKKMDYEISKNMYSFWK